MLEYKNPIKIRGTHLSCPLPLTLESYWTCEADCLHCMGRRLNKIWGNAQKMANPDNVRRILTNALKKENSTPLSKALFIKKAFFVGRKADPYQPIEKEHHITRQLLSILNDLEWPYVVCSRYQENMVDDTELFLHNKALSNILVEVTCGGEADRELFEMNRTTPVLDRLRIAKEWRKMGINVGIRGEPYIPGHHTLSQFRETLKLIKSFDIYSYNIYNLHINEYTLKRLHTAGLDIEKIWEMNKDVHWKTTQKRLCTIAEQEGVTLGCPDFVNLPKSFRSTTNTCCGIDVTNAFTFNTHVWRNGFLDKKSPKRIMEESWERIGSADDYSMAEMIVNKKDSKDFYTFKNADI